jgi:tRNA-splicing ligase RtcB
MHGGREFHNGGEIFCAVNLLEERIALMDSDMDEAPMAYKDIHTVMAAQHDLVEVMAKFEPRIVRWRMRGKG